MESVDFKGLYESYLGVYTEEVEELDEVRGLGGEVHPTSGQYTGQGRKPNRTMGGEYNRSSATADYTDGGRRGRTGSGYGSGQLGSAGMKKTPMAKAITKRAELEKAGNFKRANRITRGIDSMQKPVLQFAKGKAAGRAEGRKEMRDSVDYDLYDLVLEYLLDEGLCESVENAEIMMAHMSESWVDAIVEDYKSAK
jgi:hypothetical protein